MCLRLDMENGNQPIKKFFSHIFRSTSFDMINGLDFGDNIIVVDCVRESNDT